MVRFASACDFYPPDERRAFSAACRRRSAEYTEWPSCRVCGEGHICPDHQRPGSVRGDERPTCLCVACLD